MWRYLRASFLFWFGLIFAAVGTPFCLVAIYQFEVEQNLLVRGLNAEATLVEKGHRSGRDSSSKYWLAYVFKDSQGHEHFRQATVQWAQWRQFVDGDKLPIRYLPDNPDHNRLGNGLDQLGWTLSVVFGALGLVFGGTGWGCVVVSLRRVARELTVLHSGTAVQGAITGFDFNRRVTINGRNPQFFEYRYNVSGRDYAGRSPDLPLSLERKWAIGDSITIVYDLRDPERSEADVFGIRRDGRRRQSGD